LIFIFALISIFTGYVLTRSYGLDDVLKRNYALQLHIGYFHLLFVLLVLIHLIISIYFAVKRIKKVGFDMLSFKVKNKFNFNRFLININRISAWLLLFLIIIFIITGLSMIGMLGMDKIVSVSFSAFLHKTLDWPIIILFFMHSLIGFYFYLR